MAPILRTTDDQNLPTGIYETNLNLLADKLLQEKCLIFLGSGVNRPNLPTSLELSEKMAKATGLDWHRTVPLSTVSFYYESFSSREILNRFLTDQIGNPAAEPSLTVQQLIDIIRILEGKIKNTLLVTTNYDQHFERAYEKAFGQPPEVVIYNGGLDPHDDKTVNLHRGLREYKDHPEYWKPEENTCLYKMHGCISQAEGHNLVITEEDYVTFLTNTIYYDEKRRLLKEVKGKIALSTVLFVGYSLSDFNFRVIYKAFKEGEPMHSYAVQYYESSADNLEDTRWEKLVNFWRNKRVNIINADGSKFMGDLLYSVKQRASNY